MAWWAGGQGYALCVGTARHGTRDIMLAHDLPTRVAYSRAPHTLNGGCRYCAAFVACLACGTNCAWRYLRASTACRRMTTPFASLSLARRHAAHARAQYRCAAHQWAGSEQTRAAFSRAGLTLRALHSTPGVTYACYHRDRMGKTVRTRYCCPARLASCLPLSSTHATPAA